MIKSEDRLYRFSWYLVRGLLRLLIRLEVVGAEQVPLEGALLVAPNHSSYLDPPVVGAACPRQLRYMAKAELFRGGWFEKLIRRYGAFPVHRGTADLAAIRTALQYLKREEAVLIFPEGTRNGGRQLLPPTPGVALLARQSGAPVLPVGLIGTERIWGRGMKYPRLAKVKVIFGKPFTFCEVVGDLPEREARDAFGWYLMERILELLQTHGATTTFQRVAKL
ncbi:MAG: lysophospholipid acyltransferase family protein [candidate division WOR-3 bacterium]